jgi:light-harvesting protein B-800-850 alpha chain
MNQGRIWCVVSPTVGLPLFLGSVAITSLVVHASILNNTTWMSSYWQGAKAQAAMEETVAPAGTKVSQADTGLVITVAPASAEASYVVTMAPKSGSMTLAAAAAE